MRLFPCALFLLVFVLPLARARGAELTEARVSQVIKDVKLLPSHAAARPANVSDQVRNGTAVRTGVDSRAELTFTDQTLTRLGANTIFGFNEGTRNLRLSSGAMLLRVPKNDGGAKINTATVTAAITGTTVMMEYHPDAYIKFIVLEGTGRIFRNDRVGESVLVHAGQMLIVNPKGKGLPDPVDVDLNRLLKTSHLVTDFDPLPSMDLITREIRTQTTEKNNGGLIETNLVIFGGGTAVSLVDSTDQANANEERQAILGPSPGSGGEKTPKPPTLGEAATYNGGTGNWSNANSWTPPAVPNKGNRAEKLDVTVGSGRLTQDIVGGVNISTLFMSGGTLVLANPLSLEAGLQFTGGSITAGALDVAGTSKQSAIMGVHGTTINNSGAYDITLTGGNVFSGSATFNNSGTLTLHAHGGTVIFNNVLNNTGTVSSKSGTFSLTGGGVFSGAASAAEGAFLQFNANYNFTDGATFTGQGTILFANNTTSTFSGMVDNSGHLLFNSGDLVLGDDLTLTGGGTINLVNSDRIGGSGVLTNVDNVIQGETRDGSLGNNEIGIINQSLIDANISALVLNVDPGTGGLTNKGLMEASDGGILLLNGHGGQAFSNTAATISALGGSQVQLANGVSITGGTLSTSGTGQFINLNTATLTNLTNAGAFVGDNSSITTIAGTITNNGSISLNSTANATDLVLAGNVTLTGGGTINLKKSDRIRGSGILTNVNNVIHGETNSGSFGNNKIGIVNRAAGLIDGNVSGSRLMVDPNSADGLTNLGVMQARNGGFLRLSGNGGGAFTNTAGLIRALAGSEVELTGGATIVGGTLATSNDGVIRNLDSATLNGVSLTGAFIASDSSTTTLVGAITDTGDILLKSAANTTDLVINNNVTLTGGGTLTLLNSARVTGSGSLFIGGSDGTAFTIHGDTRGGTSLGDNHLALVNRSGGLIDANGFDGTNGLKLTVDPRNGDGLINSGVLRASGGGILVLTGNGGGAFTNSNGLINALAGSEVQLTANVSITGGTLSATGTGVIRNLDIATLNSLTLAGAFLANNHSTTNLAGTIANTGSILLNSTANTTDLSISGNVTLTGGGIINLVNSDRILGSGTLTNINNTIQGETSGGTFGNNAIAIVNRALINANVSGKSLNLDPGGVGLTNQGILEASNGGILLLNGNSGQAFTNTGATISALSGSRVQLSNGTSINGGTLTTAGTGMFVNLNNATLANLTNAGTFVANNNSTTNLVGTITNTGSISLNSTVNITDLVLAGNVTLSGGGTLTLTKADRVRGSGILTNASNLIRGDTSIGGSLGNKEIGILNQSGGVINADHSGLVLNVAPNAANGLINHGLMEATHGGILQLDGFGSSAFGSTFSNSGGTVRADGESSLVRLTSNARVTGGTLSLRNGGSVMIVGTFAADLISGNSGILTLTSGAVSAANGINFNGNNGTVTDGGSLVLTAPGVTLGSAAGQINGAFFNGGNVDPDSTLPGSNGGTLDVTATGGDIVADADIEASTGTNGTSVTTGGTGGTVNLTSNSGTVTVNKRIQVSHNVAGHRSAAGGNITLKSGRASGIAINVSSTAQLLSLLDAAAPGPGGKIVIQATAATGGSQVNISGNVEADRGTVDARHFGNSGVINLTNANVHADTVKVAALGSNGVLKVGGGNISADTTLQLYAPNGNGQVVFVGNVSLNGTSTKSIAGDSVTINNGVLVNVSGPAASVYVNNFPGGGPKANYTGFGGDGQTTGTFTGSGANNPQPLSNAPPLGAPPSG